MENYLEHHGVIGQKWGVRRYQPYRTGEKVKGGKEVGAAKKVEQRGSSTVSVSESIKKASKDVERGITRSSLKNKKLDPVMAKAKAMTESELKDAISRMNLERQYAELLRSTSPPSKKVKKGQSFVKKLFIGSLQVAATDIGIQIAKQLIAGAVNSFAKGAGYKGNLVSVKKKDK